MSLRLSARTGLVPSLALLCLGILLPACECAGPDGPPLGTDAGDTGPGFDTGPRDAPALDTGPLADAGCVPATETCDGTDEDCDGLIDESVVRACGTDDGVCVAGAQTCVGGAFGACVGETLPSTETCDDGMDEDCDAMIDEDCSCTDGTTQPCGSDVGECALGTQTCASSMWGVCVGEVIADVEICDGLDNDCDGTDDELFVDLGAVCDGPDADSCTEGARACLVDGSGTTCSDATGDSAEVCGNGTDDDCDGTVDEGCVCTDGMTQPCGSDVGECAAGVQTCAVGAWGACVGGTGPASELCNLLDDDCDASSDEDFALGAACDGPDADLCTEGVNACDAGGGVSCSDATGDSVEVCNGMDDDCDGMTDEGNPGGGVICAGSVDVGACIARTACVAGAIVCRGTFVAAAGTATATGASNDPLPSITAAIANAGILGGGADVCVCDAAAAGPSTFTENVTMVEGTSVLGAYDCTSWARVGAPALRTTAIADVDDDGVTFPAGITAVTVLEQMNVGGFDRAGAGSTTAGVTITNSSPTLNTVSIRAGAAATTMGLRVVETAGATAAPIVTSGLYLATGIVGGTAIAVSLEASSPSFTGVTVGGGASALGPAAMITYGVRCTDCGGTAFTNGSVGTSPATTTGYGFHGSGDLGGLQVVGTTFSGGQTSLANSASTAIRLDTCTGAPAFTNASTFGGSSIGAGLANTTRTAISSTGAACAPVFDGGRHVGCEVGVNCFGIDVSTRSALVLRNATLVTASTGGADVGIGMRCLTGGCASIAGTTISAGPISRSGPIGIGLELDGASPAVDDTSIIGPSGGAIPVAVSRWFGLYLRATSSVLTNCLIAAGTHVQPQVGVQYDQTAAGPALVAPTIHSSTIVYATCTGCAARTGLVVSGAPGGAALPMGIVRNTIFARRGIGGVTRPVEERNAASDLLFFQNNLLFDPSAPGGGVYLDEGVTGLTTTAAINALMGAGGTVIADPALTPTFHIPAGSPAREAGTATGAPARDFDGEARPNGAAFDIGADEFVP